MAERGGGGGGETSNQRKRRHPQADVQQQSSGGYGGRSGSSSASSSLTGFGTGAPRTLHVLEFAEARAREIASLTHILSASGGGASNNPTNPGVSNPSQVSGGGRRVFQSLPRHMRRRAMSHNIKRLPGRLQAAAKREMDKIEKSSAVQSGDDGSGGAKKGPSRRTRRRPRNILALHAHRMSLHQWLETHVWHAKRMHMTSAWGYRFALRPTDRSLRACYNANVHLATIFDASATQVLALRAHNVATIAHTIKRFVHAAHWSQMQSAEMTSGHREGMLHLHQAGAAPYGFIAAVKYQWQGAASSANDETKASECQLWLWLHPSVYALVQSMIESVVAAASSSSSSSSSSAVPSGVSVVPLVGQLCRIELRGHRCQAVLRMTIRAVEEKKKAAAASDIKDDAATAITAAPPSIASLLTAYASPALFPAHAIYSFQAQHPERMSPPPSQPFEFRDGAAREKARGPVMPKRNNTFSRNTDETMAPQLSRAHHTHLFDTAQYSAPLVSPLFDDEFRRRHTRETAWGAKKQRYTRIAVRETERKRKMHARRAAEKATPARDQQDDDDDATMSDTTSHRRKSNLGAPPAPGASSAASRSKDDLDVGSATTHLPSSRPLAAPLTNQPYLLLVQQPGSSMQCTASQPKTHINSPAHSLGSGWDVVCGAGWAAPLWKALIYAGARAIGQEDRARFAHEQGHLDDRDPVDAPDSHAGQIALLERRRVRQWHADRIPTNKKANFQRNHVAHPFAQPFAELLEIEPQTTIEERYEASIRKTRRDDEEEEEKHSDDEAARTVVHVVKTKKQKVDVAPAPVDASADATMTDGAVESTADPSSRKSKKHPRPDSVPPFELQAVSTSFAQSHLPFYVWRHWREEYESARAVQPSLTVPSFLTSTAAPPLCNVLLPVSLQCRSGGLPEDDAFICAPLESEWTRFRTETPAPPVDDPNASHNERHAKPQPWDVMNERNNHATLLPHPLRASVGYVSHGWFSYQHGSGIGLGFVAAAPFVQLMTAQTSGDEAATQTMTDDDKAATASSSSPSVWVWTRNQNSLTYRAAQVQLL